MSTIKNKKAFYVSLLTIGIIFVFMSCCKRTRLDKLNNGIVFYYKGGALRLMVCTDRIVRVIYDPNSKFPERKSLVVEKDWESVPFEVSSNKKEIKISTAKLYVTINKRNGALSFFDKSGELILKEDHKEPRIMKPVTVMGESTYHGQQNFKLSINEGIYGLGQHQEGIMNYRGHDVELVQKNEVASVPFLISTKNYGILWDNYSKTKFHDGHDVTYFWSEVADLIDYYFIFGRNMDDVIKGYRELTGQAPMYPKWAYGYWQSKERYKTRKELVEVVEEYWRRKIPLDLIIQDWLYWGDASQWSAMKFDQERYPEPEKLINLLHDKYHTRIMVSIWPILGPKTEIYGEMEKNNLLLDPVVRAGGKVYDAYNEKARKIYWKHINEGLFSKGVDALWMDSTEPEVGEADERHIKQLSPTALGPIARYLNTYSLVATKGVYEGWRSVTSDKRVVILTRSAFAGQQRYAAATWSGDVIADWKVFRNQISAGLNFCLAGLPYWTTDIGGFYVCRYGAFFNDGCDDPGYRELYVRWFQYGAFCPLFRSHGTDTPREVWRFGEPGHWAYDTLVKYDILRYRLLPYIYSLAWKVTSDGYTIMRGLPIDFRDDPNVLNIDNQFMFGPALLICPVTAQMYYGEDYTNVLIPSEHLFTPEGTQGGVQVEFFNGTNFEQLVTTQIQKDIDFDTWVHDLPEGVNREKFSIRWSGELKTKGAGEYEFWISGDDGVRFWLEDKLMLDDWKEQRGKNYRIKINLEANKKYKFRIDQFSTNFSAQMRFAWATPEMEKKIFRPNEIKKWPLYLPRSAGWYDFWTGENMKGGQRIERDVPIDIMPIYVRAGSIIPLGPELQYATEKPADPIELRIYPGANASFILYEDENDNYNYEKGSYSLIPIEWNEENQTLTIGERIGRFPGMIEERTFSIVWVKEGHGIGIDIEPYPDKTIVYKGKPLVIKKERS